MDHVTLRPVRQRDLELILAWRSHPTIYRHFRDQNGPLDWESHAEWFQNRPPGRDDYLICYRERRVGCVAVTEENRVSIYIGETTLWESGVASAALKLLCEQSNRPVLYAEIHEENTRSQRLFEGQGFLKTGTDGEWLQYRRKEQQEN